MYPEAIRDQCVALRAHPNVWAMAVMTEAIEKQASLHETMTVAVNFNCGNQVLIAIWWTMRSYGQFGVNSDIQDMDIRRRLITEIEEDWERYDEEYHYLPGRTARQEAAWVLERALKRFRETPGLEKMINA